MNRNLAMVFVCVLTGCNLFSSGDPPQGWDVGSVNNTNGAPNNTADAGDNNMAPDMPGTSDMSSQPDMGNADTGLPDVSPPVDMSPTGDFAWDRDGRVARGLLLYYTFEEGAGLEVIDRAPRGGTPSLALGPTATWLQGRNGVHIDGPERISGPGVSAEIVDWAVPREEITVEVWVKPDNLTQSGPARIVTFSENSARRNFTIGQREALWVLRFSVNDREFDANGSPEVEATVPVTLTDTQITFTYDGLYVRLYVNGVPSGSSFRTGGLQHWDRDQVFQLGNENVDSRPWAGEIHKLAVYDRALNQSEVLQNYLQGPQD